MLLSTLAALALNLCTLTGCGPSNEPPPPFSDKRIAITIDDAPVTKPLSYRSQWERTLVIDSLTRAAQRFGAPLTVFAIGSQLQDSVGMPLIDEWMRRGVDLGNHSMTHADFGALPAEVGIREILDTQALLSPVAARYNKRVRYFRFPLLAEGQSAAQKAAYADALRRAGLTNARVTISNLDWDYDNRYTDLELRQDWAARYEVGQAYLQHMRESIAFWDRTARELTGGRPIAHVLLLHANRVNRDYLGQILAMLRAEGYRFVSLDEAYRDPIYREAESWVSPNGVSFLEQVKQTRLALAQ
ncbi:MAG TPA: polysaccharide deacetylase family protein [Rhodothermales bacterium]|nr:polysaccharide deacetylase family protein [Rhodothermales bacterium]